MRVCNLNRIGIHNGQGLGGYPIPMGSEWLTSVPIHNNPVAQLVEQHPFKVMVVGSNPTGITIRDVVQSGRTLALGARGRWFKSSHLDTLLQTVTIKLLFISKKFRNLYCKLIKELYEF